MTKENNAVCSICGKEYYACLSCSDAMKLHPYKIHCCSPSHFQVFQVVRGLSTGVYTRDEAKEKFKNIDLTDIESFRPHIRDIVKDVLKEDKPVVKAVEKVESIKSIVGTVTTEVKEEKVEKPIISRKKNYKVEIE